MFVEYQNFADMWVDRQNTILKNISMLCTSSLVRGVLLAGDGDPVDADVRHLDDGGVPGVQFNRHLEFKA